MNNFIIVVKFHGFRCLVFRTFPYVFEVQYQSCISKKSEVRGLAEYHATFASSPSVEFNIEGDIGVYGIAVLRFFFVQYFGI